MAFAFDTLGYAKHLENAGVGRPQAEAHAEAVRGFVMVGLVTKSNLTLMADRMDADAKALRADMERLIQAQTIRLGGLLVVAVGALAALLRLT